MVVDDFDLVRMAVSPYEAGQPLVVDADRMLPGTIPFEAPRADWQAARAARRGSQPH